MPKHNLDSPRLYINRELSWLEFNDRVLREGVNTESPLMERLKFLAITSSNLDEFFMIRVAGLMQQRAARVRRRDPSGLTPVGQLELISNRAHRLVAEHARGVMAALSELRAHEIFVLSPYEWTPEQRRFLANQFANEILPVLTPLAVQELEPRPVLPAMDLNIALLAASKKSANKELKVLVIPVPRQFPRFLTIPAENGLVLAKLEDVIAENASLLLTGMETISSVTFRITRDADVAIADDAAADLLQAVEKTVLGRRRRMPVRLEVSAEPDSRIRKCLVEWFGLRSYDVYEVETLLDATCLFEIANRHGYDNLKVPEWTPQPPRDLLGNDNLWEAVRDHDVMLFHPYESFDAVVQFVQGAADDPNVFAIKMTLYRTSGDSPIVGALERAALAGKQVIVLVELKARFDEARNVIWARRLEEAGCHVIYGIAGFKTHSKALLVVRREGARVRRYVHLSTGNYNDKTARLYSDIGLMTCDKVIAADVAAYFNLLTGFSEEVGWAKLTIAPTGLRRRFIDMVEREIEMSSPEHPGLIMAKVNSLEDKEICKALYAAAQAGVKVMLNVRGICCLRPSIKKISENIEVVSILDRFLEHARVFYFRNGGHEEVYMSSADWMGRNLDRRLEILFPVSDPKLCTRVIRILNVCFEDNVKSYRLLSNGTYERKIVDGPPIRAQETFYADAVEGARGATKSISQFRPLSRPEE